MSKLLTGLLALCVVLGARAQETTRKITGSVREEGTNTPLAAATIHLKGKKTTVLTDADGKFSLTVPESTVVLEVTSVGYTPKEITVDGTMAIFTITLTPDSKVLSNVVVTALGVRKSEKSVTYSTQQVSGAELTRVRTDNLMDALDGKVAGVTISPSASGVGGSAKVILRGSRSAAGGNQPLYVIDGIPISNTGNNIAMSSTNTTGGPNSTYGGSTNTDQGDGISNLNPDDIESMTVLKGASASALYGSQAANGVIVITTKKGRAGHTQIQFSSLASMDKIAYKPKFQNEYGQTQAGATTSWGPKLSGGASDNLKDFFQTGDNFTNSISLSGGSDVAQTYFSYANTTARGVEPMNKLDRNNFNFRETAHLLNNKLTVDVNTSYITQEIHNTPGLGLYFNPLTGLYLFPRGLDMTPYKTNYAIPDSATPGVPTQNWPFNEDVQQNPWWIVYKNPNEGKRNRLLINASVRYDFAPWLYLQARGNVDRTNDIYEQDLYAGTIGVLSKSNGQFFNTNQTLTQKYGDIIAGFNTPSFSGFKIDGLVGSSITDANTVGLTVGPDLAGNYSGTGLYLPNIFLTQNLVTSPTATAGSNAITLPNNHNQIQSIFGNLNFSYKEWVYLTLTGRNDWSSNLAFTPNDSYFYPSAGLSFILSQLLKMPSFIDYLKVRGTYAQVGNTVQQYATMPLTNLSPGGTALNTTAPFPTLKPEKTKSTELGADFRFLDNRLSFNFTWYKSNTFNQFIQVAPSFTTTYAKGYVNAGNIQNEGIEFMLGYDVVRAHSFTWNTSINGSTNKNKVIDLDSKDGINSFILTGNANNSYQSEIVKGGSFGDIYGVTVQKDAQGRVMIGSSGTPLTNNGFNFIGNPNPKFQLGWSNSFTYKNFSLEFLVDGKFGGQVLSMTQAMLDQYGVSKVTGDARDAGSVKINAVGPNGEAISTVNPQTWYTAIGGRAGISGEYVYSASVVRLREAALGYTFPLKSNYVHNLRLSITGRNLAYFYKKAPYDPELTMSTGNGLSGVDVFNQPATRNLGVNLNVTF
ncbi:MAG TPA: SusC/RagA family TonB-linked outer membrane protein [Dinghuibacter sp.]|uniref:SusC/RagA family TonB-linked outer membrane protein n=1 Tax=Dinghuibacter sp. TaxID=2024697 RepID=UPI002BB8F61E|nr:SusC/RagA family TonB-linked outer membrane protein [Dinghuibacter sp.]HTJ14684.1 SusC/RagA family TonB-linked outer membrane protein [Dinghuibacter sp.]